MKDSPPDIFESPFFELRFLNLGIVLISLYFLFEFGSLQGLYPVIGQLNLPFVVALLTAIYAILLVIKGAVNFKSRTTKYFTIFWLFFVVYTSISTKGNLVKEDVVKLAIIYWSNYIVIISSIKNKSQFVLLIDIWLVAVLFSCYHASMQGGLVWGNRWLKDENHISLVAATAFPFALIFFVVHKSKIKKMCYGLCLFGYATANIIAHSRGGALSLGLALILCMVVLKHKFRNLIIISALIIVGLHYAPPAFFQEMATLELGTHEETADDRIYLWRIALNMFTDHPLLGVGPMNYPAYFASYEKGIRYSGGGRVAHSTPIQYLAETGIIGIIIFGLFQISLFRNWWGIVLSNDVHANKVSENGDPNYVLLLTHACIISQIAFHFGALFLTLLPYPFYWCLVPFSEAWKKIGRAERLSTKDQ